MAQGPLICVVIVRNHCKEVYFVYGQLGEFKAIRILGPFSNNSNQGRMIFEGKLGRFILRAP